jgi:hypothetical protein
MRDWNYTDIVAVTVVGGAPKDWGYTVMETPAWSNEEMAKSRTIEAAAHPRSPYQAEPMSDERIAQIKEWAHELADGGDYNDHPCEYGYAENILDLIARIDELKAKVLKYEENA